jgi:pantothenate kinase
VSSSDPPSFQVADDATDYDDFGDLINAARSLIRPGQRRILGIAGAPGSGKSTVAEILDAALGEDSALVGLDGFHLANAELHRLNRHDRKGAPETFDAAGYVNLLRRLRTRDEPIVYAPLFDRSLEESIAGAVAIPRRVPLIVTEGNYLLVEAPEWGQVLGLLDECWYVDPGEEVRLERLVARHRYYGRSDEQAHERSYGSDQRNAELIAPTRQRASRIIRVPAVSALGLSDEASA